MDKLTHWEKKMKNAGYDVIQFTHEEIMEHLLQVFVRDREHLMLLAASDETNRHKLIILLDYENIGDNRTIFGGTVTYDKRKRKFTHITYSDRRNWAVQFSIESKVAFFAYDYYKSIKHLFPFGYSVKRLAEWLKNN